MPQLRPPHLPDPATPRQVGQEPRLTRAASPRARSAMIALALLGFTASALPLPKLLAGRYSRAFDNEMLDGSTYPAKDVVDIAPVDASHAYLHAELEFANAHHCSLAGIAAWTGDRLIYRERTAQPSDPLCRLSVSVQDKWLVLDDEGGSCRAHCGTRGSFSDFRSIRRVSRRPIPGLAALRHSARYRAAIDEWKSDTPE